MSETLYDLSSLPSTLSLISPAARRRQQTGDSVSLLEPEETQEKLKKCDKTEQNISSPAEKDILSTKNNAVKDKNFLRRLARVSEEVKLQGEIFLQYRRGSISQLPFSLKYKSINKLYIIEKVSIGKNIREISKFLSTGDDSLVCKKNPPEKKYKISIRFILD